MLEEQQEYQKALADAQEKYNSAQLALTVFNLNRASRLKCLLDNGRTTGDYFKDSLIRTFGLDKQAIDAMEAFNKRLKASKGKQLYIAFRYVQQISFRDPGPARDGDFTEVDAYAFGTLTGEELGIEFNTAGDVNKLLIPFERYIVKNMDLTFQPPNHYSMRMDFVNGFLSAITGKEILVGVFGSLSHVRSKYLITSDIRKAKADVLREFMPIFPDWMVTTLKSKTVTV